MFCWSLPLSWCCSTSFRGAGERFKKLLTEEIKLEIQYEYKNHCCSPPGPSRHRGARLLGHHLHDSGKACRVPRHAHSDHRQPLCPAGRRSARARRRDRVAACETQAGLMSEVESRAEMKG